MSADEGGDTTSMPVTNGEPNPSADTVAVATPAKRKRPLSQEEKVPESTSSAPQDKTQLHETLQNLVELLLK